MPLAACYPRQRVYGTRRYLHPLGCLLSCSLVCWATSFAFVGIQLRNRRRNSTALAQAVVDWWCLTGHFASYTHPKQNCLATVKNRSKALNLGTVIDGGLEKLPKMDLSVYDMHMTLRTGMNRINTYIHLLLANMSRVCPIEVVRKKFKAQRKLDRAFS
jgi:hypothetical protein